MACGINEQGVKMADYEINGVKLQIPDELLSKRIAEKLENGRYEGHEANAALMRVRGDTRVLELGSGLGYIASICAAIAGPENVTTVEANPDMLPVVRGNLERNGFAGVTLVHGAVTGQAADGDVIEFERTKAFWGASIAREESKPDTLVSVPLLRLSDLLKRYRPHIVIMDIEGAEQTLFDDLWPAHVRSVMMELHPGRYPDTTIKKIIDCLSASGLTYDPGPSRGRIVGFRRLRHK